MSLQVHGKLNQLLQSIPGETVVTSPRLHELGVSPQLVRKYVQSGWLNRVGSGAFSRTGENPSWLGGVYALQSQLGLKAQVAAVSALELQGRAHFVPLEGDIHIPWFGDNDSVLCAVTDFLATLPPKPRP